MADLDRAAIENGTPGRVLMERAASYIADLTEEKGFVRPAVFCGSGNNGGDGFAAARILKERFISCDVFVPGGKDRIRRPSDAYDEFLGAEKEGIGINDGLPVSLREYDCIIDALFGTGLCREITGVFRDAVEMINSSGLPVISADIPSGVHSATGRILGCAVRASYTVTFSAYKTGHFIYPGRELSGDVRLCDIGVAPGTSDIFVPEKEDIRGYIPERYSESNKGTYGKVLSVSGSSGMMGAAIFTSRSAYRAGAGLVLSVIPSSESACMTVSVPEAVQIRYDAPDGADAADRIRDILEGVTCAVIGPGLGRNEKLFRNLLGVIPESIPVVIDADGLNILSAEGSLDRENVILTPHMMEASRLCGKTVGELYRDVTESAVMLAERYRATVVLKSASTVTASYDGRVAVNTTGNHGMSTAGTGDCLAGIIAGLAAQKRGCDLFRIAAAGAYLHGHAGDLAAEVRGRTSLMASDLIDQIKPDLL